ncbi:MAG: phosphohistidine phosphatase SixA [Deltaproteobacteria bacterium]
MAERCVYLVRHGIAEDCSSSGEDFDRELTRRGVTQMETVARGLATLGVEPRWILSSPYRRARQTADILCATLTHGGRKTWDELGCGVDEDTLAARLAKLSPDGDILLVGHEPDMGELLSWFLTGRADVFSTHFSKAAVACIRAGMLPPMGRGRLEWFERASVLERLALA